ncbi:unnamed protein product [Effrenium voratum]|nr:unnamed protein product [Effrenium voratum]
MPSAKVQANDVSFSATISACEKGGQWQQALALFRAMPAAQVQANIYSFSATISACGRGGQWQHALALLRAMPEASIKTSDFCFAPAISACGKDGQWQQALALFFEMHHAEVEPNDVCYNCLLDALRGKPFGDMYFEKALQQGVFQTLAAAQPTSIDLHGLSEGAAQLAVWWWLHTLVLPELGSADCEIYEVITGYGKSRREWDTSDIRAAAMSLLQYLKIQFRIRPRNAGLLELRLGERDLQRLKEFSKGAHGELETGWPKVRSTSTRFLFWVSFNHPKWAKWGQGSLVMPFHLQGGRGVPSEKWFPTKTGPPLIVSAGGIHQGSALGGSIVGDAGE